jgi:hypothetical protein
VHCELCFSGQYCKIESFYHIANVATSVPVFVCFRKEYGFLEDALLIVFQGMAAVTECRGRCGLST